jgi:hypothetical protein
MLSTEPPLNFNNWRTSPQFVKVSADQPHMRQDRGKQGALHSRLDEGVP